MKAAAALLRRRPAHQRVLPALAGVKVHPPLLGAVDAGLHGGLGGHEDVDFARLDVLLRHPRQRGDVLLGWGGGGKGGGGSRPDERERLRPSGGPVGLQNKLL